MRGPSTTILAALFLLINFKQLSLEGVDSNLIIIDIKGSNPSRIINVYKSFNPQNGQSQREKFKYQLSLIKEVFIKGTILLGDFNQGKA